MGNNIIIGVDHGYGYIKSAGTIFKSGVEELPIKPPFMEDILELKNRTFVVGQIRNEHPSDKTKTDEYYNLTLVSLAKEMKCNGMTEAKNVILAAGLPYSFFSAQKDQFKEYLLKKKTLNFSYEGEKYHIELIETTIEECLGDASQFLQREKTDLNEEREDFPEETETEEEPFLEEEPEMDSADKIDMDLLADMML